MTWLPEYPKTTYREPSIYRLSWHIARHVPVQSRFVIGDKPCLLTIRPDGRNTAQGFPKPGKDRRSTNSIEPLEFPRRREVISHDDAVCETERDDHEEDDRSAICYDRKRAYHGNELDCNGLAYVGSLGLPVILTVRKNALSWTLNLADHTRYHFHDGTHLNTRTRTSSTTKISLVKMFRTLP